MDTRRVVLIVAALSLPLSAPVAAQGPVALQGGAPGTARGCPHDVTGCGCRK
jgi:hypothetical protein